MDVRRGSGTFYNLAKEIERQGHEMHYLGPFQYFVPLPVRASLRLHRFFGKRHPVFLDPLVGRHTGKAVMQKLDGLEFDVLLTNCMASAAFTLTSKPVVTYTDVMITPEYSEKDLPGCRLGNMSWIALGLCRQTLRRALKRSSLAVFPAEWCAQAARAYCQEAEKVRVIPFGANVTDPGPEIANRRTWKRIAGKESFDLLFVGKDWVRKGGDVAVDTVRCLNACGVKARLHVVGAEVPGGAPRDQVREYGLLDKSNPEELQLLNHLFSDADAFILPSSSEGYVISVLEAAAFGLPTLAYNADGVRDAVVAGRTGLLFPLGSSGEVFADAVRGWQSQPSSYEGMAASARRHFETSANWRSCVSRLTECIEMVLPGRSAPQQCEIASVQTKT